MKPKTRFELLLWRYYVLLWFIVMGIGVTLSELVLGPAILWLLYDIPYSFPTGERVWRLSVFVVLSSLAIGTLIWFYEKKSSGR